MSEEEKYKPPTPSCGDVGHAVARAGVGTIPIVGAAATEILNLIVLPPLERRQQKWMEEIGEALKILEEKMDIALESLQQKDEFIDIALEATRIAIKTSSREKREALKNAILNTALDIAPEESLQTMFLSFIDTLTVWHLKLLDLFNNPPAYLEKHSIDFAGFSMGAPSHLVERTFSELKGKRDFYDLIWKDLYFRALVTTDSLHVMMTGSGVTAKRTTEIGKLFLDYIKNPIKD